MTTRKQQPTKEREYFLSMSPDDLASIGVVGSMLIEHPAIRAMHDSLEALISKVRGRPALIQELRPNILLTGQTGTGKEVVTKAFRQRLIREQVLQDGNDCYGSLNCACLSAELLEIELFGTTKDAYTNAGDLLGLVPRLAGYKKIDSKKRGLIGTPLGRPCMLFLDEIGAAEPKVQAKLLRLLENREFCPLGVEGRHYDAPNLMVVAATNELYADGGQRKDAERDGADPSPLSTCSPDYRWGPARFRNDLFYRLGDTFHFHLPSLGERRGEIPLIAEQFFQKYYRMLFDPQALLQLPDTIVELLKREEWPGNGRQLHQVIRRAMLLWDGRGTEDLVAIVRSVISFSPTVHVTEP